MQITDISLATELKAKYDNFKRSDEASLAVADISVTVLTTGFWPSYKVTTPPSCPLCVFPAALRALRQGRPSPADLQMDQMNIPPELAGCLDSFSRFYETHKKHTKLTWLQTLGHALLDVRFAPGRKKLEVSIYQVR